MHYLFSKKNIFTRGARGFTLVETLVAISVLMVALTAVFAVAQSGLSSTIAVKDRITAFFLAQEALEAVRNLKDSNLLAQYTTEDPDNPYWLNQIADPANACSGANPGGVSFVDYSLQGIQPFIGLGDGLCSGGECQPLKLASTTGLLQHTTGNPSRFTRTIAIQEICSVGVANQKEAKVTVGITWPGHPNGLVVTDNITNWFSI